ncbi:MAG: hypothetical protein WEC59_11310, partial [Salibacteraceae bacterium]
MRKTPGWWFLISLLAFVWVVIRSLSIPITPDEAFGFFNYIQKGQLFPPEAKWDANNHLLNTILSFGAVKVFGNGLFVLRLANVLAYGLFLLVIVRLAQELRSLQLKISLFVLLAFSPLLVEFFALSRGYGLSMAFLLWGVFSLKGVIKKLDATSSFHLLLAGLLMSLANLNLLPLFLLFIMIGLAHIPNRQKSLLRLAYAVGAVVLIALIGYAFALKQKDLLYYGTTDFLNMSLGYSLSLFTGLGRFWWFTFLMILPLVV